ncbi:MAG: SLBB domain-containing protein [Bacteroidetes bacterium]|nr:SLBB domain-containing protein [Bacteroidota bacterium]
MSTLPELIAEAGVVGAGGAGFPTHVKATSKVDYFLVNGAECEPLIHKDFELMLHHAEEIVKGSLLMKNQVGAATGLICIKSKNKAAIDAISAHLPGTGLAIFELGDFYPSGDEYEIVHSATGRLMPPGGIPLNVGCVVNNVESVLNVYRSSINKPVTEKFVCVTGAVKSPKSFWVPIGTTFGELIDFCGGVTVEKYGIYVGGVMMGKLTFDRTEVVTKTTGGLIILPEDHKLIQRKNQPEKNWHKIGKSACDQCSYCTEYCPRYLLGYDVQPHKVMRSLGFTGQDNSMWNLYADLCCSCGLCTLYACPEDLFPKEACDQSKRENKAAGIKMQQKKPVEVHPFKEGRRVPLKQLVKRLGLSEFEAHTPFTSEKPVPKWVKIMLRQHVGDAALSSVKEGTSVKAGDKLAEPATGKMGSTIHASISGLVREVNPAYVIIENSGDR